MKRFGHIIDRLADIGGYVSGWLVPIMIVLIFVEVFMRYVINRPPMVADEFSAYMLVAMSFLGAAYTWKYRGHVRITFLVSRLPTKVASWLRVATLLLAFIFMAAVPQASYGFVALSFKLHLSSASWLRVPLQGPQLTIPIGFTLLSLLLIVEIIRAVMNIRAGKSAEERVG